MCIYTVGFIVRLYICMHIDRCIYGGFYSQIIVHNFDFTLLMITENIAATIRPHEGHPYHA